MGARTNEQVVRPAARRIARLDGLGRGAERALAVALLGAYFIVGYYAVGLSVDPARLRTLRTPLDERLPLVVGSIYVYASVYTALLLPLFTVRCQALFRRVAAAYAIVVTVSLLCFIALPVTSRGFRPALADLDVATFAGWAMALNYHLDPPVNLFPSIHLAIAVLAALFAARVHRGYGLLVGAWAVAIAVSTLTTKQHYVADAVAGLFLGVVAYALCVRGLRARGPEPAHYGWGGLLAFAVLQASAYALCFVAFRAGVAPWHAGQP